MKITLTSQFGSNSNALEQAWAALAGSFIATYILPFLKYPLTKNKIY